MEETFTLVERAAGADAQYSLFKDVVKYNSAKTADHDLPYITLLRQEFPDLIITSCPESNAPLRAFAAAGFATCEVDKDSDSYASWRGYVPPANRSDKGLTGEAVSFAKYHYKWKNEDFIFFLVGRVQYILSSRKSDEHKLGPSAITDSLIRTIGDWIYRDPEIIWVYDGYWRQDAPLFKEVQKASWDNVILDENMKKDLTSVAHKFFDSEAVYRDLGVPWKRGLLFHGPPGNGKTISIKALMHSLYEREKSIPTLYVRSAPYTYDIGQVFSKARAQSPCMLILEDVETIVTPDTRSYFFNEMDGLANNDGLFIVASTNFLDKLDPGLSKRPSRFDRKYLFPIPNEHERTLYCEYWQRKLKPNKSIVFPKKLCPAMAAITPNFSFAFLQECFVATLLIIATEKEEKRARNGRAAPYDGDNNDDDLDDYGLWVVFKEQAAILKREMGDEQMKQQDSDLLEWCLNNDIALRSQSKPSPAAEQSTSHPCHCSRLARQGDVHGVTFNQTARRSMLESNNLLPELGYQFQKQEVFTETAFEKK